MQFSEIKFDKPKTESAEFLGKRLLIRLLFLSHTLTAYLSILTLSLWALGRLGTNHWTETLWPLLERYRWVENEQNSFARTYYHRVCDRHDFSTLDFNDLIVQDEWDYTKAAENILTHGVSVFPGVLDRELASSFRDYVLERNERLVPEETVFVMNSKTMDEKQTRWAFAFSSQDQPQIIPKVLEQIANNEKLVRVLELFLGEDPAIIKMQTITQIYEAGHQTWHSDLSPSGSPKKYARNFMTHFSLFVPLQDTTPRMGPTGVCPGTQYCSELRDHDFGCKQVASVKTPAQPGNIPTESTASASWMTGDAVLMNQDTFHRGWKHDLPDGPDRAIMVLTFTSRPRNSGGKDWKDPVSTPLPSHIWRNRTDLNDGSSIDTKYSPIQSWVDERKILAHPETRTLSSGTPLTSFGSTLYDLKDAKRIMSKLVLVFRFFGVYKPSDSNWGWNYATSTLPRVSSEGKGFKKKDLENWLTTLDTQIEEKQNSQSLKLWAEAKFLEWCKKKILSEVPESSMGVGIWNAWVSSSLKKATSYFQKCLYLQCVVYAVMTLVIAYILPTTQNSTTKPHQLDTCDTGKSEKRLLSSLDFILKSFSKTVKRICVLYFMLALMSWRFQSCTFVQDIQSRVKIRTAFPNATDSMLISSSISLLPTTGIRRLTHDRGMVHSVAPSRDDVLIGTRFDSLYLRSANHFLDYHTGNIIWRTFVRDFAAYTDRGSFFSTTDSVPLAIIDFILRQLKGKLLLQTPEKGEFVTMTRGDAGIFTRRALILEHSLLISELDRCISYMISEMRFESILRSTPLALFSVGLLEEVRETIFGESDQTREDLAKGSEQKHQELRSTTTSPLLRGLQVIEPMRNYNSTLTPEEIIFHIKKRREQKGRTVVPLLDPNVGAEEALDQIVKRRRQEQQKIQQLHQRTK